MHTSWQKTYLALDIGPIWVTHENIVAYATPKSAVTPPVQAPAISAPIVKTNNKVEAFSTPSEAPSAFFEKLKKEVARCQKCSLHSSRNKTVFGMGVKNAEVFIIGEGPGYYENISGEPFVGRAGQLLDNALKTLGLSRHHNSYIANIIKCRATQEGKDRRPNSEEITACCNYLKQQIAAVMPRTILCLGGIAATTVLNLPLETPVRSLRTKAFVYPGTDIAVVVTYHPAYLLRNPKNKMFLWQDLCYLKSLLHK